MLSWKLLEDCLGQDLADWVWSLPLPPALVAGPGSRVSSTHSCPDRTTAVLEVGGGQSVLGPG